MEYIKIYILDIVLVLIFVFNAVYYYKKGFVRSLLEFISFFASGIVARVFSPVVSDYLIKNTNFFTENREYKIELLTIILMFVLASAVFKVIINTVDRFFGLPVLRTVNKFFGLILGALTGILIVMVFTLGFKIAALSDNETVKVVVSNSKVMSAMSDLLAKIFPAIAGYIQGGL